MPSILLGSDLKNDLFIEDSVLKFFREWGYEVQTIYPLGHRVCQAKDWHQLKV
jgi:hypothetical protein